MRLCKKEMDYISFSDSGIVFISQSQYNQFIYAKQSEMRLRHPRDTSRSTATNNQQRMIAFLPSHRRVGINLVFELLVKKYFMNIILLAKVQSCLWGVNSKITRLL